jgi:uncharacterized protein (TIRG00374 family)
MLANFKHTTIKRGLEIFCGITVLAICLLIIFTTNVKTIHALKSINVGFLILSFILICLSICFDVLRLIILARAVGVKIPFIYGTKAILSYTFLSNITPSSAGGEPLLMYMLNQRGVTFGKATAISLLRTMITMAFFAVGGPIIIYFHRELLSSVGLKLVFDYVSIFMSLTVIFFAYLYFAPGSARKFLDRVFIFFERFKFFKERSFKLRKNILHTVDEFKSNLRELLQKDYWHLFLAVLCTALMITSQFLVAFVLLKGLGCDVRVLNTFMVQGVLHFLLYYVPTPGGSGISEGIGYTLFALFVPSHINGVFLVIWRFLTNYLFTLIGGLIIVKSIGMKHLEDITKAKQIVQNNRENID